MIFIEIKLYKKKIFSTTVKITQTNIYRFSTPIVSFSIATGTMFLNNLVCAGV